MTKHSGTRLAAVIVALGIVPTSYAQPAEPVTPPPEPAAAPEELTAADVEGAPVPGDESGRVDGGESDSLARKAGRAALFVPRGVLELTMLPVRAGLHTYKRYHVYQRVFRLLFNDAGTIGIIPTASFDTDLGATIGGRLVLGYGQPDQLKLSAETGGRYKQNFKASVRTGYADRLGFKFDAEHSKRPDEPFYGIGNGDLVARPEVPIDPMIDDSAHETSHRQELSRMVLVADVRAIEHFHVRGSGAVADVELSSSMEGPPIETVFEPSAIGLGGYRYAYTELELRWDDRGPRRMWEPRALPTGGWLASAFAGRVAMESRADFWRYGGNVQHFHRIGAGPRVISARLHGEAVTGSRDEVPFTELPFLGGNTLLRGYPTERFRDRVATVGSLEYEWDLSYQVFASLFVDAGRVYPSISDISLEELRCGYGVALEVHTERSHVARVSLATSIDGGAFIHLTLDPVFRVKPRVERR